MAFILSKRSLDRMSGIHADLYAIVRLAIRLTKVDFTVLEGLRTLERQSELVKQRASKTMNSRHLTGHAIDLGAWINGRISWDWEHYHKINAAMKESAKKLNIPIEWGGNWSSFKDGPHYQLPWEGYPK